MWVSEAAVYFASYLSFRLVSTPFQTFPDLQIRREGRTEYKNRFASPGCWPFADSLPIPMAKECGVHWQITSILSSDAAECLRCRAD
nr:hypothetical protein BaRGS_001122 [Batillaria attramentaria]